MRKLEFTKDLEGKTIYLVGTGNNARGNLANKVIKAEVVKVARVNVTLRKEGYHYDKKYKKYNNSNHYSNHLDAGCNSGYKCYYSLEDIEEERKAKENYRKIRDRAFTGYGEPTLTLKQTEAILKILEGDEDDIS